jgi:pSer/pThr/pTyr-binding forkhead associated (FHA) protein
MIEDLGSTNGTWLNENRAWLKSPLSLDDVIRVGRTRFAVTWVTSEEQG